MSAVLEEKVRLRVGTWPTAPYKGLNFYTASDAPLFCERDAEVEACGQLAAHFGTKMLLLHGRTGTGKSSFLRAGLFPKIFLGNASFFCLTDRNTGEPCLIRSTADPIASITDKLHSRLKSGDGIGDVPSPVLQQAFAQLSSPMGTPGRERAARLQKALQQITSKLSGTFVLAIDQAEEVFTLNTTGDDEARSAYFAFLEDLCYDRFDIKVILALRTEYYGQFADRFRLGPDLSVSTVRSGLEQFMLHGIQDAARLEAAILRPTLTEPVAGLGAPYETYKFTFEPGLAHTIAADVVRHCGESSTLPVMQMVCLDLYTNLVSLNGNTEIHHSDYAALGGVEGAIDRFIVTSIREVLGQCNRNATPRKIDSWRDVLSSLVARQEGGALTSLLLLESDLNEKARRSGFAEPINDCLKVMAQEKFRLLRNVNLRNPKTGRYALHYSLGHDALATSLFQWKESRGKFLEERNKVQKRVRRIKKYATASLVLLAFVTAGALIYAMSAEMSGGIRAVLRRIDTEPQVRLRLLLLAALERNATWLERAVLPMSEIEATLRDTLIRAPILATSGAAAGFGPDGNTLVLVTLNGTVVTKNLSAAPRVTPAVQDWKVDLPPILSSLVFAAGFVEGLDSPVIYKNGSLSFNTDDGVKTRALTQVIFEAKSDSQKFPDFGAGVFRLTGWAPAQGIETTQKFYDLQFDSANRTFKLLVQPPPSTTFASRFAPVYADTTQLFAFTENDESGAGIKLYVASRNEPSNKLLIPDLRPASDAGASSSDNDNRSLHPWSIAFLPNSDEFVYRDAIGRFTFVDGISKQTPRSSSYTIPPPLTPALEPVRPQWPFGRPVLAAARTQKEYRVAWVTDKGMSVFRSQGEQQLSALPDRSLLLTSLRPVDSFTHLRFSNDGELLLLSQQLGGQVVVRAWDLSDRRLERIKSMSKDELVREACLITKTVPNESGGNRLSPDEFKQLPVASNYQPCPE